MSKVARRQAYYAAQMGDDGLEWRKYRPCDLCGRPVCYNNWPDKQGRQKRYTFKGKFLCPYCDPREWNYTRPTERIKYKARYKVLMSVVITEKLATLHCKKLECDEPSNYFTDQRCGKCLPCLANKLVEVTKC